MPPALEYIRDRNSLEYQALEAAHGKEYDERAARFRRHWAFYDGDMSNPLKIEDDGVDDNVLLPKVDQVADRVVSFLLADGVTFDAGGNDERTAEDEAIERLWAESRGATLQHNLALSGTLAGHCVVRIEPREGQMPRLVNVNPAHFSAFWSLDDIDRVLWYRLQYTAGAQGKRIDYVRGQPTPDGKRIDHEADGWWEMVYKRDAAGAHWEPFSKPREWPFSWPPLVDWQNLPRPHAYYGVDDVRRAVALNAAVNLIASDWNRILKHHAAPKTIGLGMDSSDVVATAVGGFFTVSKGKNEGADIYNLEMQSDLKASQELLSIVLREIWQSARMVDPQTVKDAVGKLTNFGLRVLLGDALSKTATKRLLYAEGFEQIAKRGLELAGVPVPEKVATVWPDVLPEDAAEVGQALLKELEAGILDRQTYRSIRGYDHEQIEQRLEEEKAGEQNLGERLIRDFVRGQELG